VDGRAAGRPFDAAQGRLPRHAGRDPLGKPAHSRQDYVPTRMRDSLSPARGDRLSCGQLAGFFAPCSFRCACWDHRDRCDNPSMRKGIAEPVTVIPGQPS
jgi:hypothetical protein